MSPGNKAKKAWPEHLSARLTTLRKRMEGQKLDALLVCHPQDIRYLTGFCGEDSWAVVSHDAVTVLSDFRFEEELSDHFTYTLAVMRKKSLSEELAKLARRDKTGRIGIQAEHFTLAQKQALVKHVPAAKLKETTGWLVEQRSVKDAHEVRLIRRAVGIQQAAFTRTLRYIKPGMTEKQVCAILEFEMKLLGADGPAFGTIIGSGANSSIPHYRPGDVAIKAGSPVLIDFGAVYNAYHSDMTRVISFGKPPAKVAEIYKIVREAQLAGIAAIKPGATLKGVDAAARKVITKAGFGKEFGHSLGHGIGLEIHEAPRLAKTSKGVLKPGMVVTVEPGIYLPGIGGVRLEDDILVTQTGHENLCSLPTDLKSAIISV